MLKSLLVILFSGLAVGSVVVPRAANKVVTITTYTTTTVCPITRTFTNSGTTLTTTKLTTSTFTVAVERTVTVPGSTGTLTEIDRVNVTRTMTNVQSVTLPPIENTTHLTSYGTIIVTANITTSRTSAITTSGDSSHELGSTSISPSVATSASASSALASQSTKKPSSSWPQESPTPGATSTNGDAPVTKQTPEADRPRSSDGSTTPYESMSSVAPSENKSKSTSASVTDGVINSGWPTTAASGEVIEPTPTRTADVLDNKVVVTTTSPQPPNEADSTETPASAQVVTSQGDLLHVSLLMWVGAMSSTFFGFMWGSI